MINSYGHGCNELPDWMNKELSKLEKEYPDCINRDDVKCLEWSDIEIFVLLVHYDFSDFIMTFRVNTNYDDLPRVVRCDM